MKKKTVNDDSKAIQYQTLNDLPAGARAAVITLLNQRLADAIDLQAQIKQAHWNVKGPSFIALHELFDDIFAAQLEYVDLIAERVVQLGGIAEGTIRVAVGRTRLDEYPLTLTTGQAHVEALSRALSDFGHEVRLAIDEADGLGDADSADIFTEVSRGIDKWLWFVEAHMQTPISLD